MCPPCACASGAAEDRGAGGKGGLAGWGHEGIGIRSSRGGAKEAGGLQGHTLGGVAASHLPDPPWSLVPLCLRWLQEGLPPGGNGAADERRSQSRGPPASQGDAQHSGVAHWRQRRQRPPRKAPADGCCLHTAVLVDIVCTLHLATPIPLLPTCIPHCPPHSFAPPWQRFAAARVATSRADVRPLRLAAHFSSSKSFAASS
jgi:hypothetical protein